MHKRFDDHYSGPQSVAAGPASLVHTQETTEQSPLSVNYRSFLTSGCKADIDHNRQVYATIDGRDALKRTQSFDDCRSFAWFVRHKVSGKIRVASSRCSLRWCPLCIRTKRFIMIQSIIPWLKVASKPKFVTFTLRHTDAPLEFQIKSLYDHFKNLRRRPYWKKRIIGGVWFFQIKKSANDGLWHPHIHVLCDGRYVPQKRLSTIWADITKGSKVVDIRAVKNVKKAADYVARYASAPCRLSDLDIADSVAVVDALHGKRICGTFGTGKDIKLAPSKCPDASEWEYLESFSIVLSKRLRDDFCMEIYDSFVKDRFCRAVPNPEPPPEDFKIKTLEYEPTSYKQFNFEWSGFYGR